jgi:rare lipoprotein A
MKHTNKFLFIAGLILLSTTPLSAQTPSNPRLAILPIPGGTGGEGETIAELFSFQPEIKKTFVLVSGTSIKDAIDKEKKFQKDGLTNADNIKALGKQLNAEYVLTGRIAAVAGRKLLLISIIHIERLQQIAGAYREYRNIEDVESFLPEMAKQVAAATKIDTGTLRELSVVPFDGGSGVNQQEAEILTQILATDIVNSGAFAVFPRTSSLEQVKAELDRQRSGVSDLGTAKGRGIGENPDYVLSVNIRKLGAKNMFNAAILNVVENSQGETGTVDYTSVADGIRAMKTLAGELTGINLTDYSYTVNTAEAFRSAIDAIDNGAPGDYTITINKDFALDGITFATNAQKTITIRGDASLRTISNSNSGYSDLFTIPNGITLVLGSNIRLNGKLNNNQSAANAVSVQQGGTLRMETGATITGAEYTGVFVDSGTFTMNGGTISSNNGGVTIVDGGTFTMSNGTISSNTTDGGGSRKHGSGGGVLVGFNSTFTMSGGIVSGNTANLGGGVFIESGSFTMSGGIISGNTASSDDGGCGGGVFISGGVFIMRGGTISGNTASGEDSRGGGVWVFGTFTKTGGAIDGTNSAQTGKVAYIYDQDDTYIKRDTAAGPGDNLDSSIVGWEGGWEDVQTEYTFRQEGPASWYGAEFAGRPTASGQIFNPSQFTTAHPSLPFGTVLTVTNLLNNKQVQVTVNDRGPFNGNRIIDVSRAAAERLDMLENGVTQVIIDSKGTIQSNRSIHGGYWVQARASTTLTDANDAKAYLLERKGLSSVIVNRNTGGWIYYLVLIGPYQSQDEANYWCSLFAQINGFEESTVIWLGPATQP